MIVIYPLALEINPVGGGFVGVVSGKGGGLLGGRKIPSSPLNEAGVAYSGDGDSLLGVPGPPNRNHNKFN